MVTYYEKVNQNQDFMPLLESHLPGSSVYWLGCILLQGTEISLSNVGIIAPVIVKSRGGQHSGLKWLRVSMMEPPRSFFSSCCFSFQSPSSHDWLPLVATIYLPTTACVFPQNSRASLRSLTHPWTNQRGGGGTNVDRTTGAIPRVTVELLGYSAKVIEVFANFFFKTFQTSITFAPT